MKERILAFLRSENKTSSQFAEEIGVQASSVSHIISGRNRPSLDFILKMLQQYDDLNTDWLILGKGEMFKNDTPSDLFSGSIESPDSAPKDILKENIEQVADNEFIKNFDNRNSELANQAKSGIQRVILIYSDGTFREFNPA